MGARGIPGSCLGLVLVCTGISCGAADRDTLPADDAAALSAVDRSLGEADGLPPDGKTDAGDPLRDADENDLQDAYPGCVQGCALASQIDCPTPPASCIDSCATALQSVCGAEYRALIDCNATVRLKDYECDPFGSPTLRRGVCAAQMTALIACLQPDFD